MHRQLIDFWKDAQDDPFDVLFEHAPVLMHSIDRTGQLLKVSRYWADLLGYDRAEMIGRPSTDFLSPASRLRARDEVLPEFLKTGTSHNIEYDFVTCSGELMPVRLSATSILNEHGEIVRSIAILFDNREAKAAEVALSAKAAEAEAANRAKSKFLASMSHEIRTPMNAIMGFAELLKLTANEPKAMSHADAILTAGGSLMTLLNDLLDLSQPDDASQRAVNAPVDLHDILSETADWWRREAVRKGLDLSLGIDVNVPAQALVDGPRLQKILNNLLGNAVKFTASGTVGLQVARNAATGTATFTITDSGPGIATDVLAQLTHSFHDAGSEIEKQHGGLGLGLAVCQNLVFQLGGTLALHNRPVGGCEARVSIPLPSADADNTVNPTQRTENPNLLNKRILVAEDNPLNQELMKTLLEGIGCHVTLASDGIEAVELAGKGGYDAILMDITMPQLDGVAAAELIQGLPAPLSDVPIVACTAHVDEQSQARYRRAGMAGFLPKPVSIEDITTVLGHVNEDPQTARAI